MRRCFSRSTLKYPMAKDFGQMYLCKLNFSYITVVRRETGRSQVRPRAEALDRRPHQPGSGGQSPVQANCQARRGQSSLGHLPGRIPQVRQGERLQGLGHHLLRARGHHRAAGIRRGPGLGSYPANGWEQWCHRGRTVRGSRTPGTGHLALDREQHHHRRTLAAP